NIIPTDQLTIINQFDANYYNVYRVENLEFRDAEGNVISTLNISDPNNYTYTDLGAGGTEGNDYIELNSAYSGVIETFGGNDTIYAYGDGDYNVDAGVGNDYIYTSSGNDIIKGGSGNDQIGSGAGNDIIDGGDGNDYINSESGNDIVYGGSGADTIITSSGDDVIYGDAGDDIIYAGAGNDHIYGGDGNDIIYSDDSSGDYGNDIIEGGKGDDIFTMGSGPFAINAGNNTYVYNKGDGNDSINEGSAGNDVILLKGITPDEILFVNSNSGFAIKFKDANGNISTSDSIRIANQFGYSGFRIEKIKFADVNGNVDESLTIDISDPNNLVINVFGTDGNDNDVRGSSFSDIFNTGKGNDSISDYGGSDTYIYNIGDGTDMIFETGSGSSFKNDTIKFGAGIAKSDILFSISDNDVIVNFKNSSDDKIIIRNFLLSTDYKIENVEFSDGKTLDISGINSSNLDEYNHNNSAPTVAFPLESKTINQNSSESLISAATIASSFIDADGDVLTYSATLADGSALPSWLTINSTTGELRSIAPDNSTVGNHAVIITATDPDGESVSQNFSFTVNNVNDAPTDITLSNSSVSENSAGVVIGNLATSDVDLGDSFTYTVNDSRFEVVGNQLKLKSGVSLDYESASTVALRVTTTDAGGLSFNKDFTINVNNVNEAPTNITLSNSSVNENVRGGVIGNLSALDVDLGDSFTYSIVGNSNFEIVNGNQLKLKSTKSLNYETTKFVNVNVKAVDAAGLSVTKTLTINVNNVNEAPTANNVTATTLEDNQYVISITDLLAQAGAVDVDGDVLTISSVQGAKKGAVILDATSGNIIFTPTANYYGVGSFTFTVSDGKGLTITKTATLNISSVNDAPILSTQVTDKSYKAGNSFSLVISTTAFSDVDVGDVLTYSATLADGSALPDWLVFDAATRTFSGNPPSGEVKTLAIKLTATDTSLASASQNFNINITSNVINGNDSNNTILRGTSSNDEIYGFGGNDTIYGSLGADKIDGGTGTDAVRYLESTAAVNVNLLTNVNRGGYAEGDTLFNIEKILGSNFDDILTADNNANTVYGYEGNDVISLEGGDDISYGGNGNDVIYGGTGNDTLYGEAGNDILIGGAGKDTLYGGVGSDSFTFTSLDQSVVSSADVIKDFTKGEDLIDLSGLGFSSIISGRSSSNESTLYYYNSGNNTVIEDFNHTFKVTLSGKIVLTDSDFDFS
ncbi:MAG: cadherin-like domain-containing protein, partial [Rickettsiales bacterium]|nr:cadherin-like domain-containing protein [Rickettsiales bacterium]